MPERREITTFRERIDDGKEVHASEPAVQLIEAGQELLEAVHEIGQQYAEGMDPTVHQGMGLWVKNAERISRLPSLTSLDKRQPNAFLYPVLDAFGRLIYENRGELLRGRVPTKIRAIAVGPEADRDGFWHCDVKREHEQDRSLVSRTNEGDGRIVLNVDSLLRPEIPANIKFVDGEFMVDNTVLEPLGARSVELLDVTDPLVTVVTRSLGSVISINDSDYSPLAERVRTFDGPVLVDLGPTTLHAGQMVSDNLRLSLQCFYEAAT